MIASAKLFDFFLISNFLCKKHRKINYNISLQYIIITKLKKYVNIYHNSPLYEMNASFTFLYLALGMSNS